MRNVWIKTDVTAEPVTVQEAKLFCKVTGTGDDALFSILIRQARESIEQYCGISLAEKTYVVEWDKIPSNGIIELPYGPVKSISAVTIKYEDSTDADETLVLNDDYYVTKTPWSELRVGYLSVYSRSRLRVEYIVGYGVSGNPPMPYPLKVAMFKEILTQYDIREDINIGNVVTSQLGNSSRALAHPYKRTLWFAPEA